MTPFLDMAPVGGGVAIIAAVAFFFVFLAVAFVVFKLLKKTVKMAFRVVIVAIIVAIAVSGSIFLVAVGTSKSPGPTPRPTRSR